MSRVLFLDDDPDRGAAFLAEHPDARWVQTAEACLAALNEPWDEVHLDHDLGGEQLVNHEREDCGMAVVRWLCAEPRPHLEVTRFVVHTHNAQAACIMTFHLQASGYQVVECPFGAEPFRPTRTKSSWLGRLTAWLGRPR